MAEGYAIAGSLETVELVGTSQVLPVWIVTAIADPSGFSFAFIVGKQDFNANDVNLIAETLAPKVNASDDVPGVEDLVIYLDLNRQGQYVRKVDVTVSSTSGNTEETISVPYNNWYNGAYKARVAAVRERLDGVEAL